MEKLLIRGAWFELSPNANGSKNLHPDGDPDGTVPTPEWDKYCEYCRKETKINFALRGIEREAKLAKARAWLARF